MSGYMHPARARMIGIAAPETSTAQPLVPITPALSQSQHFNHGEQAAFSNHLAPSIVQHQPAQIQSTVTLQPPESFGEWTKYYNESGRPYYFRVTTGETTWVEPMGVAEERKRREEERREAVKTADQWITYATGAGREYYFNTVTRVSTWEKPLALQEQDRLAEERRRTRLEAVRRASTTAESASVIESASHINDAKPQTIETNAAKKVENVTAERRSSTCTPEARAAFMDLLRETTEITSSTSWDEALPLIAKDLRYAPVKPLSRRKECFEEYRIELRRADEEAKAAMRRRAQENFESLLVEYAPRIQIRMRYSDAARILEQDERFRALESDRKREDLFYTFIERREVERREERKSRMETMATWLSSKEASRIIREADGSGPVRPWREICANLKGISCVDGLEPEDALQVYETFQEEAARLYAQERERLRVLALAEQRKAREDFRRLLEDTLSHESGCLHARARWKDVRPIIENDERLKRAETDSIGNDVKSEVKEMFEDFVDALAERLDAPYRAVRQIMKARDLQVTAMNGDIERVIAELGSVPGADPRDVRLSLLEMADRAHSKAKKFRKKQEKNVEEWLRCLQRDVRRPMSWEEASHILGKNSVTNKLESPIRRAVFDKYMQKMGFVEPEEEEEGAALEIEDEETLRRTWANQPRKWANSEVHSTNTQSQPDAIAVQMKTHTATVDKEKVSINPHKELKTKKRLDRNPAESSTKPKRARGDDRKEELEEGEVRDSSTSPLRAKNLSLGDQNEDESNSADRSITIVQSPEPPLPDSNVEDLPTEEQPRQVKRMRRSKLDASNDHTAEPPTIEDKPSRKSRSNRTTSEMADASPAPRRSSRRRA